MITVMLMLRFSEHACLQLSAWHSDLSIKTSDLTSIRLNFSPPLLNLIILLDYILANGDFIYLVAQTRHLVFIFIYFYISTSINFLLIQEIRFTIPTFFVFLLPPTSSCYYGLFLKLMLQLSNRPDCPRFSIL